MDEQHEGPEEVKPKPVAPDAWKEVVMGQASHPLLPPHPAPPEATEDELTAAAMEDPGDVATTEADASPTLWRVVVVMLIALVALAVVFRVIR